MPRLASPVAALTAVAALAVAQLGLGISSDRFWGFTAALVLFFTAFNLLEATLPSLISKVAPVAAKGTAMGIYSTSQFAGAFFGGLIGGWLFSRFGWTATTWLGEILVAVVGGVVLVAMALLRPLICRQVECAKRAS